MDQLFLLSEGAMLFLSDPRGHACSLGKHHPPEYLLSCSFTLSEIPFPLILLFRAYRVSDGAESETRKGQLNKFSKQQPRLDVWSADVGAGSTVRVCVLGNR